MPGDTSSNDQHRQHRQQRAREQQQRGEDRAAEQRECRQRSAVDSTQHRAQVGQKGEQERAGDGEQERAREDARAGAVVGVHVEDVLGRVARVANTPQQPPRDHQDAERDRGHTPA